MVRPLRGAGGLGPDHQGKRNFFNIFFLFVAVEKKFLMTTKPKGGGVKALVVGPLEKDFFFAASLTNCLLLG